MSSLAELFAYSVDLPLLLARIFNVADHVTEFVDGADIAPGFNIAPTQARISLAFMIFYLAILRIFPSLTCSWKLPELYGSGNLCDYTGCSSRNSATMCDATFAIGGTSADAAPHVAMGFLEED
ncbi:hypothetical protein [Mesorhizobium sp.]|uniref:hypothetical protein n=1 Tax=Mesorhizobium sp. TaxID=1871066 RepID=UPI0025FB44E8|nr:hypothetical protein [Mesorhizobium sp.]